MRQYGNTVGYPSDSLASCYVNALEIHLLADWTLQSGLVSAVEWQDIRKALDDGALDLLAPATAAQKDIVEFRERVLRWIEEFDQRSGNLTSSPLQCSVCVKLPFDVRCCLVGTVKHPVSDQVKSSFVIFDIRAL